MKQLLLNTAFAAFLLSACNSSTTKADGNEDGSKTKSTTADTAVSKGDNSSNALDWPGTYSGTIPCADCTGTETKLILNADNTYTLTIKHGGKSETADSETKGTFSWNKEGMAITLSGISNAPSKYLVGENKLYQLDEAGNRITGNLAERYILQKQ